MRKVSPMNPEILQVLLSRKVGAQLGHQCLPQTELCLFQHRTIWVVKPKQCTDIPKCPLQKASVSKRCSGLEEKALFPCFPDRKWEAPACCCPVFQLEPCSCLQQSYFSFLKQRSIGASNKTNLPWCLLSCDEVPILLSSCLNQKKFSIQQQNLMGCPSSPDSQSTAVPLLVSWCCPWLHCAHIGAFNFPFSLPAAGEKLMGRDTVLWSKLRTTLGFWT